MSGKHIAPTTTSQPINVDTLRRAVRQASPERLAAIVATTSIFLVLFWSPLAMTLRNWWTDPDAGHGLLLGPLALYLMWRAGISDRARPQPVMGLLLLVWAVLLRYIGALAAEWFTMRAATLTAVVALTVFRFGIPQIRQWWLPLTLLALSIPLPAVVLGSLALPLQLEASALGATLLEWRKVPVLLAGNVIHLPGQSLFVTEACSGLRSITALLSLGVLIGGLWLRFPITRIFLATISVPVAVLLNAVRVFLTGFLVYFVSPEFGNGFMHATEGWITFLIAFLLLGAVAYGAAAFENRWFRQRRLKT